MNWRLIMLPLVWGINLARRFLTRTPRNPYEEIMFSALDRMAEQLRQGRIQPV